MKKQILGLATLSLLIVATSCKNETVEKAKPDKQVSFKTALGKQTVTRATEFTNASWEDGNEMTVYAYLTGSDTKFHEFDLTLDTGEWGYDNPKMSTGAFIRYYTWFPQDNVTYDESGLANTTTSFEYTVQAEASQEDLIAATITTDSYEVVLPFKHVLSQVNFGIVKTMGIAITITNIKINGVKDEGVYTFGDDWDDLGGSATYAYTHVGTSNVTDGQDTGISYMGNTGNISTDADNSRDNALMLMPQIFAAEGDGTLTFDFHLTTWDKEGNPVYFPSVGGTTPVVANLCDFDTSEWLPGKRYLYLFDFSSYLNTGYIKFSVAVDDWVDETQTTGDKYVAETLQVTDAKRETILQAIGRHSLANAAESGLKAFPIAVSVPFVDYLVGETTITDLELAIPDSVTELFDEGDAVRIEMENADDVAKLLLDAETYWTRSVVGRVVTLTRNATPIS